MATRKSSRGSSRKTTRAKGKKSSAAGAQNLHEAFLTKMCALLDIEEQLVKALPKMAKKATEPKLKEGFEKHLEQTKEHADRLREAFELVGAKPKKMKVEAIRGLVKDAEWTIQNSKTEEARDAAMIGAAQYVEHYEIAGYGTAVEWAKLMGHQEVQRLLEQTLQEEKDTDMELNKLATSKVNERALQASEAKK